MSADMPAHIVVRLLNHIFSEFDHIIKKYGCEKIKTIGDGYMAIAGAPVVCDDHAERMAGAAMDMLDVLQLPEAIHAHLPAGSRLQIRIGMHTGAVVAGVVGEDRFVYDVYSDAVNTAARMESHGESGRVHVSSEFVQHLQSRKSDTNSYSLESRGVIDVKGKGKMETFFLERG
jgi:class 3 adenylate cyclase